MNRGFTTEHDDVHKPGVSHKKPTASRFVPRSSVQVSKRAERDRSVLKSSAPWGSCRAPTTGYRAIEAPNESGQ